MIAPATVSVSFDSRLELYDLSTVQRTADHSNLVLAGKVPTVVLPRTASGSLLALSHEEVGQLAQKAMGFMNSMDFLSVDEEAEKMVDSIFSEKEQRNQIKPLSRRV